MTTMTIVWEPDEEDPERKRLGAVAEHFIAIWGEPNGDCHMTFCVPPDWQPLADKIEAVLEDWQPLRPIWEWPSVTPEASDD